MNSSMKRSLVKPVPPGILCVLMAGGAAWTQGLADPPPPGQAANPIVGPPGVGQPVKSSDSAPPSGRAKAASPAEAPSAAAPAPSGDRTGAAAPAEVIPTISITPPSAPKHELAVSGDFHFGSGDVTMPFNYALVQVPGFAEAGIKPQVLEADRESLYYGATLSYGYKQTWYLDLSYSQGSSSGSEGVPLADQFSLPAEFEIDDTWYQAYIRYAFPGLRGKKLSAYLRAGVSYVTADLTAVSTHPALGLYQQDDETTDILGNIGFGLRYSLIAGRRARLGLQVEGEGFYGTRTQDSLERLPQTGLDFPTATIDNTLYGAIGRVTLRFEYAFGRSRALRAFADGGVQMRYTEIEYPDPDRSYDEMLWGPYVKIGLRYAF